MVAQAQFSTSDVDVAPGESVTLELTLINLGNHTETFTLVPAGLLAGWVRLNPPTVTLFGGSQETITATLRPPQLATTPAGPAPLTVRIIPQEEPDEVIICETTADIGAFHDRRLQLLQPVVRSRRRAVVEFLVENHGNSQASCRLHLIDTSRRLDGDFDPPAVGVEPGGNSLVRLKMKAVRRHWRRGSRTLPFSIEADQPGFPTAIANATFVQPPVVPERLGRRLLGLIVIGGAATGAWFGLIRPLVERTARDAVGDSATVVMSGAPDDTPGSDTGNPTPTVTTTPTGDSIPTPSSVEPVEGSGISSRFEVTALPNQPGTAQASVPADQEWRITDFILQSVNDDGGLATVYRNDEVIQQWDLASSIANVDPLQPFTPIVFRPGDTITFQIDCQTVGGVSGTCDVALLISGLSYPAA